MFKNFLQVNFSNINDDMKISSYVNLNKGKEDIWIKVGKEKKSIRFKTNDSNIIHKEYIYNFTNYLEQEKVPIKIIDIILKSYFSVNISNYNLRKVNKYFIKNEQLLIKLIKRFVIENTDILIYGDINNFTYINKDEIISFLLKHKKDSFSFVHFSHLILSSKNNNEIEKFILRIKWHNLNNDIKTIRKKTCD